MLLKDFLFCTHPRPIHKPLFFRHSCVSVFSYAKNASDIPFRPNVAIFLNLAQKVADFVLPLSIFILLIFRG